MGTVLLLPWDAIDKPPLFLIAERRGHNLTFWPELVEIAERRGRITMCPFGSATKVHVSERYDLYVPLFHEIRGRLA